MSALSVVMEALIALNPLLYDNADTIFTGKRLAFINFSCQRLTMATKRQSKTTFVHIVAVFDDGTSLAYKCQDFLVQPDHNDWMNVIFKSRSHAVRRGTILNSLTLTRNIL